MAKRKAISLSNELLLVVRVLDCVRATADHWTEGRLDDRSLPRSISASLVVLIERLRFLDLIVRDAVDPGALWCPENAVEPAFRVAGDKDVIFTAWSDKKHARRVRRSARAARRRRRPTEERSDSADETDGEDVA